jgi:hypothetical protein
LEDLEEIEGPGRPACAAGAFAFWSHDDLDEVAAEALAAADGIRLDDARQNPGVPLDVLSRDRERPRWGFAAAGPGQPSGGKPALLDANLPYSSTSTSLGRYVVPRAF